jgi:hypothetical protein
VSGLPKTGIGVAMTIGGVSYYLGAWQIAAIGVGLVIVGVLFIRLGWRRGKPVNAA